MFVVVSVLPDKTVRERKHMFDRERDGFSQKYRVEAEGAVFLTAAHAQAWIDKNAGWFSNAGRTLDLEVREI